MPTEVELIKAELAANPTLYAGLPAHRIVDVMNNPRETGTVTIYRPVATSEVYDACSKITLAKLQAAVEDYAVATNAAQREAAAAGVEFYGRLTDIGSVDVTPGSTGRRSLDAALAAGYLPAAEAGAIVAVGSDVEAVKQTLWQVWGWTHSVTIALVEEALA